MNIAITFRHLETSEAVKDYATEKVAKLQKFLRQPMRARVTLAVENKKSRCEAEINAGPAHFVATETLDDMYAAIDGVIDKLERQINHEHGAKIAKTRHAESAGQFAAQATGPRGEGTDRGLRAPHSESDAASLPASAGKTVKLTDIVTLDRVGLAEEGVRLDKRASLLRLSGLLAHGLDAPPERILAILEEREALQSTGIGDGVAVPHGTIEGARGQVGALLLCPGGVDFDAVDDQPAKILFGVVGPRQAVEHLKVLARISRVLRNGEFRARLLAERETNHAFELLRVEDDALG